MSRSIPPMSDARAARERNARHMREALADRDATIAQLRAMHLLARLDAPLKHPRPGRHARPGAFLRPAYATSLEAATPARRERNALPPA